MASPESLGVLIITGKLRPRSASWYVLELAKGLKRHGCNVAVVCTGCAIRPEFVKDEIKVATWRELTFGIPLLPPLIKIEQLLGGHSVSLLHVQGQDIGALGRALLRQMRCASLLTAHPGIRMVRGVRRLHKLVDAVIALSEDQREDMVNVAKVPEDRISVIPLGVDVEQYPASYPSSGASKRVVGMVAVLEPRRGHDQFLDAASKLVQFGHSPHFVIAGSGKGGFTIRRMVDRLGLAKHVTFVEDMTDYRSVLSAIDVVVQPAPKGDMGFTMLQAMAMGKAVVAEATGGAYYPIRDGETGLMVAKGDTGALVDAVSNLLKQPERALELGRNARQYVLREFGLDKCLDKTLKLYDETIRKATSGTGGGAP